MTTKEADMKRIWVTIIIFVITVFGSIVSLAWTGGGRVTCVEKDVSMLKMNDAAKEEKIKENSRLIQEEQKRNIRIENQYNTILEYMRDGKEVDKYLLDEQRKQTGEIILIKEKVGNLERADDVEG